MLSCHPLTGWAIRGSSNVPRNASMRGIEDRETSKSTEGICAMCFNARLCRHASLIRLALLGELP